MKPTIALLTMIIALLISFHAVSAADEKEKKDPPKFELSAEEKAILEMTNAERAKVKLPPLTINPILCKVARGHSENMAKQEKMEHVLDGKKPGQRTSEGGYKWEVVGENVGWGTKGFTVQKLMDTWMKSKDHREHILEKEFTEIGLGIGVTPKGERYFTQVFAAPYKE
jgi:uncharacterized protein YkwD